jgi:hypothetical protein
VDRFALEVTFTPQPELAHGDHRDGHASGGRSRKGALLLDGDEDGGVGDR